jgi:hypothetical protein
MLVFAGRTLSAATRGHRARHAGRHFLRYTGAEPRIRLEILVVLIERLVERRQDLSRKHRVDLFVGRRRLRQGNRRLRGWPELKDRAILGALQQLFDFR